MRLAPAFIPANYLPSEAAVGIDYVVLCFTLILCAGTAVVFGLVPVWRLCGLRASSDRGATLLPALARAGARRLRGGLLISEVAIAFVLVVGAGLLIRSFSRLIAVDPGVERENLLTFQTTLSPAVYPARVQVLSFQEELLERIAQVPGIKSAGAADLLPLGGTLNAALYEFGADAAIVRSTAVTPGFAAAAGVRMLNGRWFSDADRAGAPQVAIVNQAFVKRFFPGRNVLGQNIRVLPRGDMTIVGVVADINLFVLERKVDPTVFEPFAQLLEREVPTHRRMDFLVRADGDPARLAPTIRALAGGIDKEQPLSDFATFHEVVAKSVERPRFHVGILSVFGCVALLLAVIGVYGVLHNSVAEMRREIGVRIALGATAWDILLMVLRRGMLQVMVGLVIGLGGCLALTRVLQSYLFETTPYDAGTLAAVAAVVTCAALAACVRSCMDGYQSRPDCGVALRVEEKHDHAENGVAPWPPTGALWDILPATCGGFCSSLCCASVCAVH